MPKFVADEIEDDEPNTLLSEAKQAMPDPSWLLPNSDPEWGFPPQFTVD